MYEACPTNSRPDSPLDNTNFLRIDSGSGDEYRDAYEATRPNYGDSSSCELLHTYHSSKIFPYTKSSLAPSLSFGVAHDVDCGSGAAAAELAKRFAHVVASDNNASSLDAARRRLTTTLPDGKVSFVQTTSEDLASHCPPHSAGFIAAAECLPLMDASLALSGFAKLFKLGGTLAIWFYGRPHFTEPEYRVNCQLLFDRIIDRIFAKVINVGGLERRTRW